ncbi:hypothetical protein BDZ91DRAFT_686911 [Kalaharituber pfeilii]|nr:hypothetical protein BDZ91DRAFT_686911 [Kalaharituber pfeilii]
MSTQKFPLPPLIRDRDLLVADEVLTERALDTLWDWFRVAHKDNIDPQMIFVKIVNSVRKPYSDQLAAMRGGFAGPGSSCYTPSEGTIIESLDESYDVKDEDDFMRSGPNSVDGAEKQQELSRKAARTTSWGFSFMGFGRKSIGNIPHYSRSMEEDRLQQLEQSLKSLRVEFDEREEELQELREFKANSITRPMAPTLVALKSVAFRDRYVQMNGECVKSYVERGGGSVRVQTFVAGWETFQLERHPDGAVSFKSTCFLNVYMRAEARGLGPGQFWNDGGGVVNCQYGCGALEKFWIRGAGNQGEVAIEPVANPGRYIRLDGNYYQAICLQGVRSHWEKFYLVILG